MKLLLYLIYILCFAYITLFYGCAEKDHPLLSELVYIDSIVDEKPDSAAVLLSQIPFEHKKADKESEALYHLLQIKIALLLGDELISDSIINPVIEYYEHTNDNHKLAYAYLCKAKNCFFSGTDSISMLYTLKAIDKIKSIDKPVLSIEIYNHLGMIYLFQNLPKNSLQAFRKVYGKTDMVSRKYYYKPLLLRNIGRVYNLKTILNKAKDTLSRDTSLLYYREALTFITDNTPRDLTSSLYREISTIYVFKKEYPKALEYLELSKDSMELLRYYGRKADIFLDLGELDSANYYCEKCLTGQNIYSKCSIYNRLYNIERIKKNYWKALKYADTLFVLNDSMNAHIIPGEIMNIQKKYSEEKHKAEKAILQVKYEKEKSHSLLVSFVVVILLFFCTCIYIYSYLKKKKLQQSLLQQKNELLLLNQKIQQWNQQVELSQSKIQQLEQEKEQIESDLYVIANEKESALKRKEEELAGYRKQKSEMSTQKSQYEELYLIELKKLFLSLPLSRKIPVYGTDNAVVEKLNTHSQEQLMNIMDEICYNFASRLHLLLQESTEKTCLCCLIKLQVKPKYIMALCDLGKEAYYKQCQRIAEKLIGKSSISGLKEYLDSF